MPIAIVDAVHFLHRFSLNLENYYTIVLCDLANLFLIFYSSAGMHGFVNESQINIMLPTMSIVSTLLAILNIVYPR